MADPQVSAATESTLGQHVGQHDDEPQLEPRPVDDGPLKMQCPFCSASSSTVVRSYGAIVADEVVRRRRCEECRRKFPTFERVDYERLARELAAEEHARIRPPSRRAVDLSLWQLAATWENAEKVLHRLWGQVTLREYRKDEWGAFQNLLGRLRAGQP